MPGRGTPKHGVRVPDELWQRAVELAEPDLSAVLREFLRWYVREPGATLPRRP